LQCDLFRSSYCTATEARDAGSAPPADPQQHAPENSSVRISQRAILQQREKTFRESLMALPERVNQLKQEVEALQSSDVFSVRIYKEAGEIEHLAKHLKTLAKG
jgi:hypothetical protein